MHGETKEQQKAWIDDQLKKWKQGITLYDALNVKNNQLSVDEQYKQAYDNIDYVIKSRIEKFAEAADGMATNEQKAAITQNAIGALALYIDNIFRLLYRKDLETLYMIMILKCIKMVTSNNY